jgi:hypothetical protein
VKGKGGKEMKEKKEEVITWKMAWKMALEILEEYYLAPAGKRVVSDWDDPTQPYIQEQNSWSMSGEVFSVECPGLANLDLSRYREDWDCDHLSDEEVMIHCIREGDMVNEIEELAKEIYTSANSEWDYDPVQREGKKRWLMNKQTDEEKED